MKYIKNILLPSCLIIFAINIIAMNMEETATASTIKKNFSDLIAEANNHKNQYFIYEQGTKNGVWVNKKIIAANSKIIKSMIKDIGDESNKIALDFPLDTIKLTFNMLSNKIKNISKLSLEQIISITNLCNYLDVPSQKLQILLALIKKTVDTNEDYNALKELHPDVQKLLLLQPTITCLKNIIIKKYLNERKQPLIGHLIDVHAIAFHPNGKQFVSGSDGAAAAKNLILWDISNPDNITNQTIEGPQEDIISVAFSPDGTKIASGSNENQNNLILWDISDPEKIISYSLVGHPEGVFALAFSPDGTQLISGSMGDQNNLIVWNIDDLTNITHDAINGCPNGVYSIAFNPKDNTQIITGCDGNENNILLWNIADPKNAAYQSIQGSTLPVRSITFNSTGNQILIGSNGTSSEPEIHNNLTILNISNLNKTTFHFLVGHPNSVRSAHFNADNTKVISGCLGSQDNLILWDTHDLTHITHQTILSDYRTIFAVQFSPDNNHMVSGGCGTKGNLVLWTLITDKEEQLLKNLSTYNSDQVRLMYQICVQEKINLSKGSDEYKTFEALPEEMQDLLRNLFLQKAGLLFSIWQALTKRNM